MRDQHWARGHRRRGDSRAAVVHGRGAGGHRVARVGGGGRVPLHLDYRSRGAVNVTVPARSMAWAIVALV
jgi:hypothetical protein